MKPEPLKERYCDLTLAEKVCVLAEFALNHKLEPYNTKYIKDEFKRQDKDVKAFFIEQGQLLLREVEKIEGRE